MVFGSRSLRQMIGEARRSAASARASCRATMRPSAMSTPDGTCSASRAPGATSINAVAWPRRPGGSGYAVPPTSACRGTRPSSGRRISTSSSIQPAGNSPASSNVPSSVGTGVSSCSDRPNALRNSSSTAAALHHLLDDRLYDPLDQRHAVPHALRALNHAHAHHRLQIGELLLGVEEHLAVRRGIGSRLLGSRLLARQHRHQPIDELVLERLAARRFLRWKPHLPDLRDLALQVFDDVAQVLLALLQAIELDLLAV